MRSGHPIRAMRNAMPFHISLVGRKHLGDEIYRQIKAAILGGRLRPGDRLSPSRELARALAVSRMTVTVAYERLAGDGFVESRRGAGTFVSTLPIRKRPASAPGTTPPPAGAIEPRPVWRTVRPPPSFEQPVRFDFRTGLPESSLFPHRGWQRSVLRALTANETALARYEDPAGHPRLRATIARQLGFSRGVKAAANDILVTNGTQQALDLLTRTLLAPGDTIAVENPGYTPPVDLFRTLGLRVVGVPVDRDGLVVEALPRDARAVYVTPSHQYPLTVTLTLPRRQALLAWAERHRAAIFEDDYDSEFRFGGRPCEPLQTMDTAGRVVYIGTFSKTLLPALRVGFLVAPPGLLPALRRAKFVCDWHTSTLAQAAIAHFVDDGGFARHIRKMTGVYRQRREILLGTLAHDFADDLEVLPSSIGLHLTALARRASVDEILQIARRAAAHRVAIQVLSHFPAGPTPLAGIMLGYGAIPTARIKEGLHLLRDCFARSHS